MAGFKIEAVTPNSVELEHNGQKITLQVGMQMERKGDGEWNLAGAAQPASASILASTTTNSSATSGPGEDSDVLKRLLEKRAQEMNNEKK